MNKWLWLSLKFKNAKCKCTILKYKYSTRNNFKSNEKIKKFENLKELYNEVGQFSYFFGKIPDQDPVDP